MRVSVFAFTAALTIASPVLAANQTQSQIAPSGVAQISGGLGPAAVGDEVRNEDVENRRPSTGTGLARVPASHVPTPTANAVTYANPAVAGFLGLTHLDQRLAGTGQYGNTQFSLEPPDQGLCVGNGSVLELVNTALAVYTTGGALVAGPTPLNQFFGLSPEIVRSTPPVYGDFTSDPKCYFDADLQRWFITILQLDVNAATGDFSGGSHLLIAVSSTSNPAGAFRVFVIDTTALDHPSCPCFGDQPLIGADANGFYISTNEFPVFGSGFNGPQLYAMSKQRLAAGQPLTVIHFSDLNLAAGTVFSIQPATTPKGGGFETAAGGTEYLLNSFFTGGLDNRVVLWALTNTSSLSRARPAVNLSATILDTEIYGFPPASEQKDGPTPLGDLLKGKLEFIDANDDRMQQAVFSNGVLWAALATPVKTLNSPTTAGVAWLAVSPSVASGGVSGVVTGQGYISVQGASLLFPALGVNAQGKAKAVFTLVGRDFYPSAAYADIDIARGAGDVHVIADGAGPEDGFFGYTAGTRVARWGDYSAAATDESGNIWVATEFIPNAPRTLNANWGTFIARIAR